MIRNMIHNHKGMMVVVIFLAIFTSAIETGANLIFIYAINAIVARKLQMFAMLIASMVGGYLIFWILGYNMNVLETKLIQNENHRIRHDYIKNQIKLIPSNKFSVDSSINPYV